MCKVSTSLMQMHVPFIASMVTCGLRSVNELDISTSLAKHSKFNGDLLIFVQTKQMARLRHE